MKEREHFEIYDGIVSMLIEKQIDFSLVFNYENGYISITTYMQKEEQNDR